MARKQTFALFIPIVVVMVIVDRLTKIWAADNLSFGMTGPSLGVVDMTLVHNLGAAFGMGQGNGWLFVGIAVVISIAAISWLALGKKHHPLEVAGLALLVAGGIGNLIDRLTTGYVVDFLHFTFFDFPVFNVADMCVTCGVVLFVISVLFTGLFADDQDDEDGQDGHDVKDGQDNQDDEGGQDGQDDHDDQDNEA